MITDAALQAAAKEASFALAGVCPKFCVNTAERCKIELK